MEKPEVKTIVEKGEFKGHPTFTIWEVDEEGNKSKYPLIAFGKNKAKAIIKHQKEISEFIGE